MLLYTITLITGFYLGYLHSMYTSKLFKIGLIVGKIHGTLWRARRQNQLLWISVSDKMPIEGQRVLAIQNPKTTSTKEPLFAIYTGQKFIPPTPTYFANYEVAQSVWSDITHWMPLPATPQPINLQSNDTCP